MSKVIDPKLQNLLNNCDFKKIKKMMKAVDWTYGFRTKAKVPTVKQLKKVVSELYVDAQTYNFVSISSGGFLLEKREYGYFLTWGMYATSWDSPYNATRSINNV